MVETKLRAERLVCVVLRSKSGMRGSSCMESESMRKRWQRADASLARARNRFDDGSSTGRFRMRRRSKLPVAVMRSMAPQAPSNRSGAAREDFAQTGFEVQAAPLGIARIAHVEGHRQTLASSRLPMFFDCCACKRIIGSRRYRYLLWRWHEKMWIVAVALSQRGFVVTRPCKHVAAGRCRPRRGR